MEHDEFIQRLADLPSGEIVRLAACLRAARESDGDDVAWWEATIAVERCLRNHHLASRSTLAAHRARQAVVTAAGRAGMDADGPAVIEVACAAGDVARALVVDDPTVDARHLFSAWDGWFSPPAPTPSQQPQLAA